MSGVPNSKAEFSVWFLQLLCDKLQENHGSMNISLLSGQSGVDIAGRPQVRKQLKSYFKNFIGFIRSYPDIFTLQRSGNGNQTVFLRDYPKGKKSAGTSNPTASSAPSNSVIISTTEKCKIACRQLAKQTMLAVDCEGVDLGSPGGSLCLIQIAAANLKIALFDIHNNPELFDHGLRDILENNKIVKLLHDCRNDAAALFQHDVRIGPVLDTQICYSVITENTGAFISLQKFIKILTGKEHPEKGNAPHISNPSYWSIRPISDVGLRYAVADVELLLEAANKMIGKFRSAKEQKKAQSLSLARVLDVIQSMEAENEGRSEVTAVIQNMLQYNDAATAVIPLHIENLVEFDSILQALPHQLGLLILQVLPNAEDTLIDIIMDIFRPARLIRSGGSSVYLHDYKCIDSVDIAHVLSNCGPITDAHRTCVGRSLHRCSVIYDGQYQVGLTIRVARVIRGVAESISEVLLSRKSVLLVGPPGRGKTTLLRDIAQYLANHENDRRVIIVDTNNEIAGEATLPHHAIGNARRMKVGERGRQCRVMLEAVQNHTPETLVIDEIGSSQEAYEVVSVRQRGIQLIATTHGETIADVIQNPSTRVLLGGVNVVILSAGERRQEHSEFKTRLERKTLPSFDVCIELLAIDKWRIHYDVASAVDVILRGMGEVVSAEIREFRSDGVHIYTEPFPDKRILVSSIDVSTGT